MVKGKVEGLSPKEFFERLRKPKNPPSESKYYTEKVWKPKATMDEAIINFVLSNHFTPEDFIDYFDKNLAPVIEKTLQMQKEEHEKRQSEFREKKRIEALPENAIPSAYFGRKAYPKHFAEITKNYSLKDFAKLRTLILKGELNTRLGSSKTEFLTWLNTVISELETNETDTSSLLRRTVNAFRGH